MPLIAVDLPRACGTLVNDPHVLARVGCHIRQLSPASMKKSQANVAKYSSSVSVIVIPSTVRRASIIPDCSPALTP